MNPESLLGIVSAFAGFLLKSTAAFAVCAVVSRLIDSPARRFILWLSFLGCAAGYWLWVVSGFISLAPSLLGSCGCPHSAGTGRCRIQHRSSGGNLANSRRMGVSSQFGRSCCWCLVPFDPWLPPAEPRAQTFPSEVDSRFTSQPPAAIMELFQPLAEELQVGRSRLLALSGMTSPATFGWIQPTILLPADCLEHDVSELEDILRHELHHIRRADFAWNTFAMVCRALLFFHPATWFAVRKMQYDREWARPCGDL